MLRIKFWRIENILLMKVLEQLNERILNFVRLMGLRLKVWVAQN